jgi:peptidoglycan/xylan/chitin deacetylase (PgdA/CDA1 family)
VSAVAARLRSRLRLGPLFYGGLRALGVPAANRRLQDAGVILCYHNVVPADGAGGGDAGLHVGQDRFERQMRWLASHYTVVSVHEMVERMAAGASLRSLAAVTFDDGYTGVFDLARPILAALGLPATVFLVADAPGRPTGFWWDQPEVVSAIDDERRTNWLTALRGDGKAILAAVTADEARGLDHAHRPADWGVIRASLGRGFELGVHSATHRSLPALTDDELEYEIGSSRAAIHAATGVWPEIFAYPYGLWDQRVRACVRAAGYRAALTLDAGLNRARSDPWSLRRVNVPARISDAAFEAWTAGLGAARSA